VPVIVGKSFAENAGLQPETKLSLYIASYNKYVRTYIAYVAADEGIFRSAVNIMYWRIFLWSAITAWSAQCISRFPIPVCLKNMQID
jgi:hypothetical protein